MKYPGLITDMIWNNQDTNPISSGLRSYLEEKKKHWQGRKTTNSKQQMPYEIQRYIGDKQLTSIQIIYKHATRKKSSINADS